MKVITMKRYLNYPAFILFTVLCGGVVNSQTKITPPDTPSSEINRKEIFERIKYLASDALEGRGTGTSGNDLAAVYIAKEFSKDELLPLGDKQSFLQTFDVVTGIELGKKNSLTATMSGKKQSFTIKTDFIPLSFTTNNVVSGELVFTGFGVSSPKLNHDDYAKLNVKNKIVLVFSGHPEEDNPHSEFADVASVRSKALFAREAGASAMLIVRSDTSEKELYKLKYDNAPSDAGIVCVNISRAFADRLLASTGKNVIRILEELKKKKSPTEFLLKASISISTEVNKIHKNTSNVIGLLPGADETSKDQYIVIGAHFDHLGWGQDGSLYRGKEPMIHNGADDNASGTAALLELAQYFSSQNKGRKHSLLFIAFSGEEMGLLGSSFFTSHTTIALYKITAMINLDMVGRFSDSTKEVNVQGIGTSPVWKQLVNSVNEKYKLNLKMIDDGQGPSDHAPFYQKDIPVLFFFTGLHSDYHKPSDDYDKINASGAEMVTKFVADIITHLDGQTGKLAFTKVRKKEEQKVRGFSVYVGTIPDYAAQENGFKISGVSDGSPAEKAGLLAGDVIIKFGKTNIKNIYDYMSALGQHKPGEDVPVAVMRDNEEKVLTVHLEKK